MHKLSKLFSNNLLFFVVLFLIAFIPLYPKLPLFDIIQTWVYIRLEDFLVMMAIFIYGIYFFRDRKIFATPLTLPIITFWIVALISLIQALMFIFPQNTALFFPHLGILHYLRRIEYLSLFFMAFAAFRNNKKISHTIWLIALVFLAIIVYGFGQKFAGWPAFLTMNEEFAKGLPLRLPSTGRIASTFGGHYDLAAYLVLIIPLIASFVFGFKKWWSKMIFILLAAFGLELLLFTASRISFGVYLVAITSMLVFHKKYLYIPLVIILSFVMMYFTSGAAERFAKTFRMSDVIVDLSTGKAIGTLDKIEGGKALVQEAEKPDQETLPKGSQFINISGTKGPSVEQIELFRVQDVTTGKGEIATISGSFLVQKAFVYDISITTRLQGQWPKAIEAFKRNIWLGSGYSSLSTASDGDYHRMLGETGIIGAISLLGIFIMAYAVFFENLKRLTGMEKSFVIGVFSGLTGLFVNAVLIDVFEASKVAFTLWMLLGISMAVIYGKKRTWPNYFIVLWKFFTHPLMLFVYVLGVTFYVWYPMFKVYFIGDDFTWLRWAADTKISDLITYIANSEGFFFRPIPKLWYFAMFSIFWLKPEGYHLMSFMILALMQFALWRILKNIGVAGFWRYAGALLFGILSIHHENLVWISGQSSMLGGLFAVSALWTYSEIYSRKNPRRIIKILGFAVIFILIFLSMLSYDGNIIVPAAFIFSVAALYGFSRRKIIWLLTLLAIPLYWYLRNKFQALLPQGDYGYDMTKLLENLIGNTVGYLTSIIVGPGAIEYFNNLRQQVKNGIYDWKFIYFILSAGLYLLVFAVSFIKKSRSALLLVAAFISLGAYLGLGNISERYAFTASVFLVLSIVVIFREIYASGKTGLIVKLLTVALFVYIIIHNIYRSRNVLNDWQKAGSAAENALRVIKTETFPPKAPKNFIFINMPIRYGRAWIFPTGVGDAIWHLYRGSPYQVYSADNIREAFSMPVSAGDREVFVFDDFILKKAVREMVPVKNTN